MEEMYFYERVLYNSVPYIGQPFLIFTASMQPAFPESKSAFGERRDDAGSTESKKDHVESNATAEKTPKHAGTMVAPTGTSKSVQIMHHVVVLRSTIQTYCG
jgi:hypothetical protein